MRVDLPAGYEEEIGAIAVNAALLDAELLMFIGLLLNPDQEVGQTVAAQLQFRQRIDLLVALYALLPRLHREVETWMPEFEAVVGLVRGAGEDRNRVVHDCWGREHYEQASRLQIKARPHLDEVTTSVTLEALQQVRIRVCAARAALDELINRHHVVVEVIEGKRTWSHQYTLYDPPRGFQITEI